MKVAARALAGFAQGFAAGLGSVLAAVLLLGPGLAIIIGLLGISSLRLAVFGAQWLRFDRRAGDGFTVEFSGHGLLLLALGIALATGIRGALRAARNEPGPPPQEFRLTLALAVPFTAGSTLLLVGALSAMGAAYEFLHGGPPPPLDIGSWPRLLVIVAGMAALVALHEFVHYAAYRYYGVRARFGFLWKPFPVAFVAAPGQPLPRRAMLVVALAPAVVITMVGGLLLAVPGLGWGATWAVAWNLAGSVGDLMMAAWMWRLPRDAWIEDVATGMRVVPAPTPGREAGET